MEITLGQTLAAYVSAGLGAALAISIGVSHRQLCALISFAAGTLLATTLLHIVPETWGVVPFPALLAALFSGYVLFYLISRYVFHVCPACAASHFEEQEASRFKSVVVLLAIALTVHSLMDGIAIALGEELGTSGGHSIFFTIAIHKLPEGLALCALFLRSGLNRQNSLISTLGFELSTIAGWVVGKYFMQGAADVQWIDLMLLHISGGFIFLALHATLNEARHHSPRFILLFFIIGFVFMGLVR